MNKLTPVNEALCAKTFTNGLSAYTQAQCQVTLTDNGYRIYRTPNMTVADNGRVMWGGLIIQPFVIDSNFLIKGNTYIIRFNVKGKTSQSVDDIRWSNNAGWSGEGKGLQCEPSNISYNAIGANFNGETDFYYKFTVTDDVWKTCTTSYSSFVAGTSYNTYRDFKFGFNYASTGEMGTDLYLTNFRCYDITNPNNQIKLDKSGIVHGVELVESNIPPNSAKAQFSSSGEVLSREFIEI